MESLIKLMFVREEISASTFTNKIRKILFPFEYTRVDEIIDLVFETQREVEEKIVEADSNLDESDQEYSSSGGAWQFTPTKEIDAKRNTLLEKFYNARGLAFRRISRSKYINESHDLRVACTISKRYDRNHGQRRFHIADRL